jgi:hypothetical protein
MKDRGACRKVSQPYFGGSIMKKPFVGKLALLLLITLSLVWAPLSRKPAVVHAAQSSHKIYDEGFHQAEMRPFANGGKFILRRDGDQTVCHDATLAEAQSAFQRSPNEPLHVLNSESEIQTQAADGLTITLRGTAQLEANPAAKAAFQRAAAIWQSIIKSPITMVIDVDFGTNRFGTPYESGVLGATNSQEVGSSTIYSTVRTRLLASSASTTETSLYTALPTGTLPTDIGNSSYMIAPTSVFRALGILQANADPASEQSDLDDPPAIGFNSAFNYDFDPSDGIDANKVDFEGVALHEIGHALGFSSIVGEKELDTTFPVSFTTWDLFRFRPGVTMNTFGTAQRILSSGGTQVFFNGTQEIQLATGKPDGTGGDGDQASHWKDDASTGVYLGLMDPSARDGQRLSISQNDRDALELLGHALTAAPPSTGDTTALISGAPQVGSLSAPSAGNCVLGSTQYTIVVPAGATQLKIDLNGTQDIDLFVRFGNRVAIVGGSIATDYSSESESGTESVTITPASTKPLQAGSYFIGVGNCGPGASTYNVTATIATGGATTNVVVRSAIFDLAGVMVLKTTNLTSPADLEVNGLIVTPPLRVKVKSEAKAKVGGTMQELNLHAGTNTLRLRINGAFTNSVTVSL